MTRDDVCKEFGAWDEGRVPEEVHWSTAKAMADEIVRLRGERDALRQQLAVVGVAAHGGDISDVPSNYRTDTSDKVVKLARILAALREPSEAVSKAAANKGFGIDIGGASDRAEAMYRAAATRVIRAAVEAAEQEGA